MTDAPPTTKPHRRSRRRAGLLFLLLLALIALLATRADLRDPAGRLSAQGARYLVYDVAGVSPRTVYGWRLTIAGLADSPLAQRWRDAADRATPQAFDSRTSARLDFAPDTVTARVFTTRLKRGNALAWRLSGTPQDTDALYASLEYRAADDRPWRTVATLAADDQRHDYVAPATGSYRFVFQPALFASVQASWAVAAGGSIPMPVVGAHTYDIGGGFGAPRDGGRRRHQGIDIFAARDTPVRAVADGTVRTGNGGLGGHYIFLAAGLAGPRYYYAHLDHFAVADGARVTAGQTIGFVGNSGNAAGGPTHLHFGIYTAGGAIDPAPFVQPMPALPTAGAE